MLGFLDLQAGRAQNRFYTELENWLASVTDPNSGLAQVAAGGDGQDMKTVAEALKTIAGRHRRQPAGDCGDGQSQPRESRGWCATCAPSSR